jgi:hypothetical protein
MRAPVVIKTDLIPDDTTGVLQGLESMTTNALILEGSDDPLDHTVLLRGVRGDELLLQPTALDQGGVASAREDQAVVRSQKERLLNAAEVPVASDQGLFQSGLCGLRSTAAAEVPSEQFPGMAIDHQGQRSPVVPATPHSAHVRGPALIRSRRNRRKRLNPRPESDGSFADLPAHDLEHALDGVLVHIQQVRDRAVTKGRVLLDHGIDRLDELGLHLGITLGGLVVHRALLNTEPVAELDQADDDTVFLQGTLELQDHLSSSLPSSWFNFFWHPVPASPLRTPPAAHGAAVRTAL